MYFFRRSTHVTSKSRQFIHQSFCRLKTENHDHSTEFSEIEDLPQTVGTHDPGIKFPKINIDDAVSQQKMKSLQAEVNTWYESNAEMPKQLTNKQWMILMKIPSQRLRKAFLRKLWGRELIEECKQEIKAIKRVVHSKEGKNTQKGPIIIGSGDKCVQYGLNFNTLFRGIYSTEMNKYHHYKLLKAMMFGPSITIDCVYDNEMKMSEMRKCARDIFQMLQENKTQAHPFHITFCNMNETSPLLHEIRNLFLVNPNEMDVLFDYTSRTLLDLQDKNKIVYLTPYTTQNLGHYNHECLYVIGALENNKMRGPLSLARAKKLGLETAKFPIRQFVDWDCGRHSLKLSQALAIMNDLKDGYDWRRIFEQHLPCISNLKLVRKNKKR